MGGYVALYLSLHHPNQVKSIFTLATKFDWSEAATSREVKMLNPEKMEAKISDFVQTLQETVEYIKKELMPQYDYDEFARRQDEYEARYAEEKARIANGEPPPTPP